MGGSILQHVVAADAAEEHEQLAEIATHVLNGYKCTIFLEEVGDQEAPDGTQPVIVHHLRRVGGQKGPAQRMKGVKEVVTASCFFFKLEASEFLFPAQEYRKPSDVVGVRAEDHGQVACRNLADTLDVALCLRGAEGLIDKCPTFEPCQYQQGIECNMRPTALVS